MTPDDLINLNMDIDDINNRLDLLESVFKKLAEFDMRLDTLEFNSNLPVKPGISESLADLRFRVEELENLNHKEKVNE
jgi:hypothetical protein